MVSKEQFGKGKRVKQPYVRLKDYVTHTIRVSPSASSSFQSKSSGIPYHLAHYVNCDKFCAQHRFFLAAVTTGCEPSTYAEAINSSLAAEVAMAPFDSGFDPRQWRHLIRVQLVSQLIRVQLVLLD